MSAGEKAGGTETHKDGLKSSLRVYPKSGVLATCEEQRRVGGLRTGVGLPEVAKTANGRWEGKDRPSLTTTPQAQLRLPPVPASSQTQSIAPLNESPRES